MSSGATRVVLDNTYVSRASRALVVQAATRLGLPVRCVWLSTSIEAAQVNAAWRMVSKYGRLLGPDEMRKTVKRDVNCFRTRSAVPRINESSSLRILPKASRESTRCRSSERTTCR